MPGFDISAYKVSEENGFAVIHRRIGHNICGQKRIQFAITIRPLIRIKIVQYTLKSSRLRSSEGLSATFYVDRYHIRPFFLRQELQTQNPFGLKQVAPQGNLSVEAHGNRCNFFLVSSQTCSTTTNPHLPQRLSFSILPLVADNFFFDNANLDIQFEPLVTLLADCPTFK